MKTPFEWLVALRFLRESKMQTMLIVGGIGVGVGVIIFLSALITGLQQGLIDRTLGTQAHVIVRPPDDVVRPMIRDGERLVIARVENPPQRLKSILRWQQALAVIRAIPGVDAAAPSVTGPGFAVRGVASKPVTIVGVDPDSYDRIINMRAKLVAGDFVLRPTDVVIGKKLAADLGIALGDKLRISTPDGRAEVLTVRGIFDVGKEDLNERWAFVPLRAAQTLLNLAGGVSAIEVKAAEIFAAEQLASEIKSRTGLVADSWMKLNTQLLIGLRSQNSSSYMIQFFVIVAVALGIASVLVVSVVQKSREIGILKAMGTPTRRVVRLFLLEGALLGLAGSVLGMIIGTTLSVFFASLATNPDGSPTFPVNLTFALFLRSCAIATITGVVSAISPARRAARLDPAEVIRYG